MYIGNNFRGVFFKDTLTRKEDSGFWKGRSRQGANELISNDNILGDAFPLFFQKGVFSQALKSHHGGRGVSM